MVSGGNLFRVVRDPVRVGYMTSGRVSFRERSAVACGKSALILLKISFCHSIVDQAWQARGSNTGHLWSKHFHRKFTRLSWEKRRYRAATCDADSLRLLATAEPELVYSCETSFEYLHAGFNCWASHEKPVILSKIMVRMALNPYITEKKRKLNLGRKRQAVVPVVLVTEYAWKTGV